MPFVADFKHDLRDQKVFKLVFDLKFINRQRGKRTPTMSSSAAYKQVFEGQDPEPGDRYIGGIPYLGLLVDLCSDISYAVLDQVTDPKSKYFTNAVQCTHWKTFKIWKI